MGETRLPRERRYAPHMSRGLIWTALALLASCGSQTGSFSGIDCGTSTRSPSAEYDARGLECVWSAYSSGTAVRWNVRVLTIEGVPIPETLRFDNVLGVVITQDTTADKYASPANRRMWTWRCAKVTKTPWATDPTRYSFELSSCTGDGPTTTFPSRFRRSASLPIR